MTIRRSSTASWIKSSHSGAKTSCVEVTADLPAIAIRDSTRPTGGICTVSRTGFAAFIRAVRESRYTGKSGSPR